MFTGPSWYTADEDLQIPSFLSRWRIPAIIQRYIRREIHTRYLWNTCAVGSRISSLDFVLLRLRICTAPWGALQGSRLRHGLRKYGSWALRVNPSKRSTSYDGLTPSRVILSPSGPTEHLLICTPAGFSLVCDDPAAWFRITMSTASQTPNYL